MLIRPLTKDNVSDFIQYCDQYGKEHDESYLPNENFQIDTKDSSFLLYSSEEELIGVVSLMTRKRRFRIFHSIRSDYNAYKNMLDEVITRAEKLDSMYLFIPEDKIEVRKILEELDFELQRYTWYLERSNSDIDNDILPMDIIIKDFEPDKEEAIWCEIINDNFEDHQGFSKLEVEELKKMIQDKDYEDVRMLILWQDNKPIGTIQIDYETEDGVNMGYISWLSINESYRGLGLGRRLLKHAIKIARMGKADKVGLVVHSTNERAIQLYQSEGFVKLQSLVCYNKELSS